ncbi:MAG: hypothetical protein AAF311_16830, partial [Pseudomonadota bacterium]
MDTYVRPPEPTPSPLHELADGLSALDAGLSKFLSGRKEKASKEDAIRGEAAFYRNNQQGYAEAVKSGAIPATASPFFVQAYKKAQGSLAGRQLMQGFETQYQQWEGRNSGDPQAFQDFFAGYVRDNIGTDDADILEGMLPYLRQSSERYSGRFTAESSDALYSNSVEAAVASNALTIDDYQVEGLGRQTGTDYEGLWDEIVWSRQQALNSGIREDDFDKLLVDDIVAKAIEHRDPELLKFLDKNLPGTDYAISATPYGRDQKAQAIGRLESIAVGQMNDEAARQKALDRQAAASAELAIVDFIAAN